MIAEIIFYLFNSKNLTSDKINELHRKRKLLNEERDKLYCGDKYIRKKIMIEYAPLVKQFFYNFKDNYRSNE
jgi:hypothetical protein